MKNYKYFIKYISTIVELELATLIVVYCVIPYCIV